MKFAAYMAVAPIALFAFVGAAQAETKSIVVKSSDVAAVKTATNIHITSAPIHGGSTVRMAAPNNKVGLSKVFAPVGTNVTKFAATKLLDHGGAVVISAQVHPVYVNSTASTYGNPAKFITDENAATAFIGITNQYMRQTVGANRYPLGTQYTTTTTKTVLLDTDLQAIAHSAAQAQGAAGYAHTFNIFTPAGTNICFDAAQTQCYSPNNLNTFVFCGYHSSVDFADVGHVLYSTQPFANVNGCNTPNGSTNDAQSSVLSHELFETYTDPDGSAWFDSSGQEIGDKCQGAMNVTLNGTVYQIQREFSNIKGACSFN